MEKMNVGRSTNVGFVHSNSASLKLLVDTWTATAKACNQSPLLLLFQEHKNYYIYYICMSFRESQWMFVYIFYFLLILDNGHHQWFPQTNIPYSIYLIYSSPFFHTMSNSWPSFSFNIHLLIWYIYDLVLAERETETLNRARQLVFNNDNTLLAQAPHLGYPPLIYKFIFFL